MVDEQTKREVDELYGSEGNGNRGAKIDQPGEYRVKIHEPHWERLPAKDMDNARMQLVLPGYTDDGRFINAYLYFTKQLVSSGQNAGKKLFQVSADKCIEMGMESPFNPSKIGQLDQADVIFVVEADTYNGKTTMKVQFINTPNKPKLAPDEASGIWAEMMGDQGSAPAKQSKPAPDPDTVGANSPDGEVSEMDSEDNPFL